MISGRVRRSSSFKYRRSTACFAKGTWCSIWGLVPAVGAKLRGNWFMMRMFRKDRGEGVGFGGQPDLAWARRKQDGV